MQDRVHNRQITLIEAEALVEFAGDRRVFDELLGHVGTPNFHYQVERERRRREQRAKIAQLRSELEATGVRVIDPPARFDWDSVEKHVSHFVDPDAPVREDGSPGRFSPAAHAAAFSFHAVFVDPHDLRPVYVCTNPDEAKHVRGARTYTAPINPTGPTGAPASGPSPEQIQAAQEAEQAEEERRAEARRLACGPAQAPAHRPLNTSGVMSRSADTNPPRARHYSRIEVRSGQWT